MQKVRCKREYNMVGLLTILVAFLGTVNACGRSHYCKCYFVKLHVFFSRQHTPRNCHYFPGEEFVSWWWPCLGRHSKQIQNIYIYLHTVHCMLRPWQRNNPLLCQREVHYIWPLCPGKLEVCFASQFFKTLTYTTVIIYVVETWDGISTSKEKSMDSNKSSNFNWRCQSPFWCSSWQLCLPKPTARLLLHRARPMAWKILFHETKDWREWRRTTERKHRFLLILLPW